VGVDDILHQQVLYLSYRFELGPQVLV
jgi:hypothetical protein